MGLPATPVAFALGAAATGKLWTFEADWRCSGWFDRQREGQGFMKIHVSRVPWIVSSGPFVRIVDSSCYCGQWSVSEHASSAQAPEYVTESQWLEAFTRP